MANRANGPMIRHQQWSMVHRNNINRQNSDRQSQRIYNDSVRRIRENQQRMNQPRTYVRYDGQIVYSEDGISVADAFSWVFGMLGGSITITNLITYFIFYRFIFYRLGIKFKDDKIEIAAFKMMNRISLIFYIPLILLQTGRIIDFTQFLRQRLVEVLHPKGGAGDGHQE